MSIFPPTNVDERSFIGGSKNYSLKTRPYLLLC